jgi:hypothetical protein
MICSGDDDIYNGYEALERVQKGKKVRRVDWPDGHYVYLEQIYQAIVNNAGAVLAPDIFVSSADDLWEDYDPDWALDLVPTSSEKSVAPEPEESEYDKMFRFFRGTKKPHKACDCGAQHTGEPHSDWCGINKSLNYFLHKEFNK